jgi:hypothetical protein
MFARIVWPLSFKRLLTFMGALSFDLSYLSAVLCKYEFSFKDTLFFSTITLALAVAFVPIHWALHRVVVGGARDIAIREGVYATVRTTVYILIFAFPVISVRLCEVWMCHEVAGVHYLRIDYKINCDSPEWSGMAVYSAGWIVGYVFFFPIATFAYLYKRRARIIDKPRVHDSIVFGFLCNDYRLSEETYLWGIL